MLQNTEININTSHKKIEVSRAPVCKVPITEKLNNLLNPKLNNGDPILSKPLLSPKMGDKVYSLTSKQINNIKSLRGSVVDLHPGMGGISPDKLINMVNNGHKVTSIDFMLTRSCNFECTWCFANSSPKAQEYIPFNILESVTKEAAEIGVSLFVLTGGEPIMYRDPKLGRLKKRGDHLFQVIKMIRNCYKEKKKMDLAVEDERYEDAAGLRDTIKLKHKTYAEEDYVFKPVDIQIALQSEVSWTPNFVWYNPLPE